VDRKEGIVKKPSSDNVGVGISLNIRDLILFLKKLRRMSKREKIIYVFKGTQA
jgi:hypothetical protein